MNGILQKAKIKPFYLRFGHVEPKTLRYSTQDDYMSRFIVLEDILHKHLQELDSSSPKAIATKLIHLVYDQYVDADTRIDKTLTSSLRQDCLRVIDDICDHFHIEHSHPTNTAKTVASLRTRS